MKTPWLELCTSITGIIFLTTVQSARRCWFPHSCIPLKHALNKPGERLENAENVWTELRVSEPGYDFTDEEMKKFKIWPYGIIPYFIDEYSFDGILSNGIRGNLDDLYEATGLRFVELSRPPDDPSTRWVLFINRRAQLACEDYTTDSFTNEGVQKVVIGYDCISKPSNVAAALLALAGVPPQHLAPDRDSYVTVNVDNILPDKTHLFQILKDDQWLFPNIKYDFDSAGHYDFYKFTKNGFATIQAKIEHDEHNNDNNEFDGKGIGLSHKDVWKIRMLYNYITKKENPVKSPECSKLFKPGAKFNNYKPVTGVVVTPRIVSSKNNRLKIDDKLESQPRVTGQGEDKKEEEGNLKTYQPQNKLNQPGDAEAKDKLKYVYNVDTQIEGNINDINRHNQPIPALKQRMRIDESLRLEDEGDEIEKLKERLNKQINKVDITEISDYHSPEN